MTKRIVLGIAVLSVCFASAMPLASAATTPYVVAVGATVDYLVAGSDAFLQQQAGSAEITAKVDQGGGILKVSVHCMDDSSETCRGNIVSS